MIRPILKLLAALLACGLAVAATPARATAQAIPPIAWTKCEDGVTASFVNVGVLQTDSSDEILRHEAVHLRQISDSAVKYGRCYHFTPIQIVVLEAEAYCVSDSVRVHIKHTTPSEASAISLWRMLGQFNGLVSADSVVAIKRRVCP